MTDSRTEKTPTTLLTGGAGFVGSHVCDRLIAGGHEAVCLDNSLTRHMSNIQHIDRHPRFTFIGHDVNNPIDIQALLESWTDHGNSHLRETDRCAFRGDATHSGVPLPGRSRTLRCSRAGACSRILGFPGSSRGLKAMAGSAIGPCRKHLPRWP